MRRRLVCAAISVAAVGTLTTAYAFDVSVGSITDGAVECGLTEQAAKAFKDKDVSYEAVAPAATLPGNKVRWSSVKGRASIRLEGHIFAGGGFALSNGDGSSSMEFADPSGTLPSGTASFTVTTKTRKGTEKDKAPSQIASYAIPPSSIHGEAELTGEVKVNVDSGELHLTPSAARRINATFGTELTADETFWRCDVTASSQLG
ncbi:hypothetical protein GCM10010252_30140 [Streptomyces aureoverticillatus]|nr:hypothetical protein GCM10010252_30140 [Streptomyces aureoverticillatus]